MKYDSAWYDEAMTADDAPSMLPLEESPWLPLYREAAKLIDIHEAVEDLGCGTGRFIQQLYERGHYAPITGIDFSHAALTEADLYCEPRHGQAPAPVFEKCDLVLEWEPDPERHGNTVYTCLEVLEHLEGDGDLELVARIPPGHRFVFSLPSYASQSHERFFPNPASVWHRYDSVLLFMRWVLVPIEWPIKVVHLLEARRRTESWA